MERQQIIVLILILLVLFGTSFFIYTSLNQRLYHSPGSSSNVQFSPQDLPVDEEFCIDSDPGLDYFSAGSVVWGVGDGEFHESSDYCASSFQDTWPEGTLFEMHCQGNKFQIKDVLCPNGCEEGVCE